MRGLLLRTFLGITIAAIPLSMTSNAQAGSTMVLAGDSWAWIPCLFNAFPSAFKEEKMNVDVVACTNTSGMHIRAENWPNMKESKNLLHILKIRKDVNVVYLSLGGNDFLSHWIKTMTPVEESHLEISIRDKVLAIAEGIIAAKPDVKVVVSGYDYSRIFSENHRISNYREMWEHSGKPSVHEMHTAFLRFTEVMTSLTNGKNIFYIHHLGLMHYYYGNKEDGLTPKQGPDPEMISAPDHPEVSGGNPDMELDPSAMIHAAGYVDAYHLTPGNYILLARHSILHYLRAMLQ